MHKAACFPAKKSTNLKAHRFGNQAKANAVSTRRTFRFYVGNDRPRRLWRMRVHSSSSCLSPLNRKNTTAHHRMVLNKTSADPAASTQPPTRALSPDKALQTQLDLLMSGGMNKENALLYLLEKKRSRSRTTSMNEDSNERSGKRVHPTINPGPVQFGSTALIQIAPAAKKAVRTCKYAALYHFSPTGIQAYQRFKNRHLPSNREKALPEATNDEDLSPEDYDVAVINFLAVMEEEQVSGPVYDMHSDFFLKLCRHDIRRRPHGTRAIKRAGRLLREKWCARDVLRRGNIMDSGPQVVKLIEDVHHDIKFQEERRIFRQQLLSMNRQRPA